MKPSQQSYSGRRSAGGFTLVELLVVIGMTGLLVVLLSPALAATKPGSKAAKCMNDKRQLALAWQMYASDNVDLLVSPTAWVSNIGSFMDWTSSSKNTNTAALLDPADSLIASYVKSTAIFKCPADYYQSAQNPGPRTRSVSLDGVLGAKPTFVNATGRIYFEALKLGDLAKPGPAMVYVFLDEQADSIDDGAFMLNPGYAPGSEVWRNLPAGYHNNSGSLSFADGHAEIHPWMERGKLPQHPQTTFPVTYNGWFLNPGATTGQKNNDYEWLDDRMPYR